MKRRTRLVSNSSSCSFVLIGWSVPDQGNKCSDIRRMLRKANLRNITVLADEEDGAPEGEILIGLIARVEEGDETIPADLTAMLEEANQASLVLHGTKRKMKLYTGTQMC